MALTGLGVGMGGCPSHNGTDGGTAAQLSTVVHSLVTAKMDPHLSAQERDKLVGSVDSMMSAQVTARENSAFARAFGGRDMGAVAAYLNQRISFVIPQRNAVEDYLFYGPIVAAGQTPVINGAVEFPGRLTVAGEADVNAANFSPILLAAAQELKSEHKQLYFAWDGHVTPVSSSRIGVIQLGSGFLQDQEFEGLDGKMIRESWLSKSGTIVHEARHSDCTGGPTAGAHCGHEHSVCPATITTPSGETAAHPYAGEPICDDEVWGANGMALAYVSEVARQCTNCAESIVEEGMVTMIDRMMRGPAPRSAIDDNSGTPDLSSTGLNGAD